MPIDINGVAFSYVQSPGSKGATPGNRGGDLLRSRRDQDEQRAAEQQSQPNRQLPQRIDYDAIQRKVAAKSEVKDVNFQRQQRIEELPGRHQKALAMYSETANLSSSRASGGELVGVDVFV
ncbi:MAG: hypothetical protein CSA50_05830 [Gammaproteobacteria bacterium]|nr:MAG: hypothetical protein CSA50_05830 [Gammaproteobacteria bacterium]